MMDEPYENMDDSDDDDNDDDDDNAMPKDADARNEVTEAQLQEIQQRFQTLGDPVAFSGVSRLRQHFPFLTKRHAERIVRRTFATPLHRQYRRPPVRNPVLVLRCRQQLQLDLIVMRAWGDETNLASHNQNTAFLLTAIDTFSRYAWVVGLNDKSAVAVLEGVQHILLDQERKPPFKTSASFFTDSGKEFKNSLMASYLRARGIQHFFATSDIKAPHVERLNRTLKRITYQYMTQQETNTYVDQLQAIVTTYNQRRHRSIGMSPAQAELPEQTEAVVAKQLAHLRSLQAKAALHKTAPLAVGDLVRIRLDVNAKFRRSFHHQFSLKFYRIAEVLQHLPVTMYKVQDETTGNKLNRIFYRAQLQPVEPQDWRIETVLQRKKIRGIWHLLVKWQHFDDTHNSWIPESNITQRF